MGLSPGTKISLKFLDMKSSATSPPWERMFGYWHWVTELGLGLNATLAWNVKAAKEDVITTALTEWEPTVEFIKMIRNQVTVVTLKR